MSKWDTYTHTKENIQQFNLGLEMSITTSEEHHQHHRIIIQHILKSKYTFSMTPRTMSSHRAVYYICVVLHSFFNTKE